MFLLAFVVAVVALIAVIGARILRRADPQIFALLQDDAAADTRAARYDAETRAITADFERAATEWRATRPAPTNSQSPAGPR